MKSYRGLLNIKMLSYQYRDSHVKDKTVSSTVLSLTRESHTWERRSLYWDGAQELISFLAEDMASANPAYPISYTEHLGMPDFSTGQM